jgi:hypothetical protein
MLLVAAAAIGIVGIGNCVTQIRTLHFDLRNLVNWLVLASPLLMSVSLALAAARLLPPRPRLSEVFRQPGFAASWVMCLFACLGALKMVIMNPQALRQLDAFLQLFNFLYFWPTVSQSGAGIIVAWITLVSVGCWQAEPSWIDRSGRALGVFYITAFLADTFAWLLWLA